MNDRQPIPDKLAAAVMYASNRTCCVCRDDKMQVQIHHIDSDPSNNDFGNLAVICLNCHSEAHSKQAFARNLSPEIIRLYNSSWREIVARKLNPTSDPQGYAEYLSEALLEVTLDCHRWKNAYMAMYPGNFRDTGNKPSYVDVWDMLIDVAEHPFTEAEWKKYWPLFIDEIAHLCANIDRALTAHAAILPPQFKTLLIRTRRRLNMVQGLYHSLPHFLAEIQKMPGSIGQASKESLFKYQFTEVVGVLRDLARQADSLRKPPTTASGTSSPAASEPPPDSNLGAADDGF